MLLYMWMQDLSLSLLLCALGSHAFVVLDMEGVLDTGLTRLTCIVLTETAYLIWVLCCKCVVGGCESLAGLATNFLF